MTTLTKGKVERMIQCLRHSFFAARRFSSLDDLNGQLARWIAEVAHRRPLTGQEWRGPAYRSLDAPRSVDHVSVYTQGGHHHVVLWHVGQAEEAGMR